LLRSEVELMMEEEVTRADSEADDEQSPAADDKLPTGKQEAPDEEGPPAAVVKGPAATDPVPAVDTETQTSADAIFALTNDTLVLLCDKETDVAGKGPAVAPEALNAVDDEPASADRGQLAVDKGQAVPGEEPSAANEASSADKAEPCFDEVPAVGETNGAAVNNDAPFFADEVPAVDTETQSDADGFFVLTRDILVFTCEETRTDDSEAPLFTSDSPTVDKDSKTVDEDASFQRLLWSLLW